MQFVDLPSYDFTRLQDFQRQVGLTEEQKVALNLIIEDMISHFFENVHAAVELAVAQKIVQDEQVLQN